MRRYSACLMPVLLLACALPAGAQTMKPGLWEIKSSIKSSNGELEKSMGQLQQQLAGLPPEQRRMVEDMMAKNGVNVSGGGTGMSMKTCLTQAMVERKEFLNPRPGSCKTTTTPSGTNKLKVSFACTNPPASGEGEANFSNSESYEGNMTMTTTARGAPEKASVTSTGRWLGADCGTTPTLSIAQ